MMKSLKEIDWRGGEILVTRADRGWQIEHKLLNGRKYGQGWRQMRHDAVREATTLANARGAFLNAEAA